MSLLRMACPAMYAAMAINLHLPYWVVTGAGSYGSQMHANLTQLMSAALQALPIAYRGVKGERGAALDKSSRAGAMVARQWKELPGCGGAQASLR